MAQAETESKILGTTKLSDRHQIRLIKRVQEEFEQQGRPIERGDQLVYRREGDQIVIEPA